ncbi:energy transducer TonB [Acetobacter sacchari]|uniref:Energy transducer TonB n=1 Tax=Acetobacter sacchari TaxID=2661687 RepID=A0ABS3LXP3_9PROT|nr:energy transducer TonB [Acetobacter sacchari]MBO1360686.1 energy transducer TonB [Acetobacter sacchari]
MTVTLRPYSRVRDPREPVLVPRRGETRPGAAAPKPVASSDENGRNGLAPTFIGRPEGYRKLRRTKTPMRPRQIFADPDIVAVLVISMALHAALLAFALIMAAHHRPRGSPMAPESNSVDMMFVTPPAQSGMVGEHSDDAAGGNASSSSSQSSDAEPEKAESAKGDAQPTPETPSTPPLPQASADESYPTPTPTPAPINPTSSNSGQGSKQTEKKSTHKQSVQRQTHRQHAPSPFDTPMDLSLDQSSAPRRNRRGRSGGSGGPIDLSIGPMVQNGRLNAPYSTRSTTRGVSDDYSAEVDRWIRRHMYYPEDAARNGEEGPSSVHVVIDRAGRVRFVRLTGQSGSYELDASTTGMFHGAELPPVPPDIPGDHFDLDVTINYILIRH